ncbi:DUF6155 family protein [Anaerobacillus alkaliphilus]|nr:DUF6155 family protein [Anaerobacillus alkaliphilus]
MLKISELKKSLKQLDQKELIQLVVDMSKLNTDVKEFLATKYGGEEVVNELFNKAKKKITNEFFPEKGMPKLRLTEAKKAIADFKKTTGDDMKVADLMLLYVEMGTEFTRSYGDIDWNFYNNMIVMYGKVAGACEKKEELYSLLKDRLYSCVLMSQGTGWGYEDALCEIYYSISWVTEEDDE